MDPSTEDLLAQATTGEARAIEGLMLRLLPGLRGYVANRAGAVRGGLRSRRQPIEKPFE
mgnify:CR=1 FL=1